MKISKTITLELDDIKAIDTMIQAGTYDNLSDYVRNLIRKDLDRRREY